MPSGGWAMPSGGWAMTSVGMIPRQQAAASRSSAAKYLRRENWPSLVTQMKSREACSTFSPQISIALDTHPSRFSTLFTRTVVS